jgi:signal transduction histidine kinase
MSLLASSRSQSWLRVGRCGALALLLLFSIHPAPAAGETAAEDTPVVTNLLAEMTNHMGHWIWDTNTADKQTCRFWKSFTVPAGAQISRATVRITADNSYTLFLDGQEIGRGSDWRTVTEYDVARLLNPGPHIVAVEAFNDRLQAGLAFGLDIQVINEEHSAIQIVSDDSWRVVPNGDRRWLSRKAALPEWHPTIVVGTLGRAPWDKWPIGVTILPPIMPLTVHFWQQGWFQIVVLALLGVVILLSLWLMTQLAAQFKAQSFLQVERARIARELHDDLGAQVTQLVLLGEVAQREQPTDSAVRAQFNEICQHGRELSRAMGEVVWAVNSQRDTVRDFVTYVCKYAQTFLATANIRCRLEVEPEIPILAFDLPVRRNLFLAVKEALNNAARHSGADTLLLRIFRSGEKLVVILEDNGNGFDPTQAVGNGLANMAERLNEIHGACTIVSQPGAGCVVTFTAPLDTARRRRWRGNHNARKLKKPE